MELEPNFLKDEHKLDLVLRHRIKSEQFAIKPGPSLQASNALSYASEFIL